MSTRALVVAIALLLIAGCVQQPDTTDVQQRICTEEDINNGTCGDPGGGSPPASPEQITEEYAESVITAIGQQPVSQTGVSCDRNPVDPSIHNCHGRFEFGTYWIEVECTLSPYQPQHCSTWTCVPTQGGGQSCHP
jgi:hypothetical protein